MDWHDQISVDSAVRSGKPCVKGTRITVYDILEYLAGGMGEDARTYSSRFGDCSDT
jgi:uncharacterized protein (DUF433 family)